ncbi:MAG: retropepsin-like aspartic protease [Pseudomonadota bacterium]
MSKFIFPKNSQSIIVPVKILGPANTRYARMILDTGATYTMICPEILDDVGYDLTQPCRKLAITTASSIEYTPFFKIQKVSALGKEIDNIEVASHSLPPRVPADGLLGLNFLRSYKLTLHVDKGYLELT